MRAFHINWTAPFFTVEDNAGRQYHIDDFEILTTILSALKWREMNGSIKMYTDKIGEEYYHELGITDIWDLGIDTSVLENSQFNINPYPFWAAGKLIALRSESAPCVMIDTDFIVWEKVTDLMRGTDVAAIHTEELHEKAYVKKELLKTPKDYEFGEGWSWTELPCNTAFVYFGNEAFKEYYTREALRFMDGNPVKPSEETSDRITHMIFAEQRMISICAKKMGLRIKHLMAGEGKYWNRQKLYTHTWGYKSQMRNNSAKRQDFCVNCINRILSDYPDAKEMLYGIKPLEKYLK